MLEPVIRDMLESRRPEQSVDDSLIEQALHLAEPELAVALPGCCRTDQF